MTAFKNKDKKLIETVDMLIEKAELNKDRDLIVVSGDLSSANKNEKDNIEGSNRRDFEFFCTYLESKQIPWTFTFGNHDSEYDPTNFEDTEAFFTKAEVSDYLESLEYCTYKRGDIIPANHEKKPDSYGQYSEPVLNNNNEEIMRLVYMDSNNREYDENGKEIGTGGFSEAQVEWYKNEVNSFAKKDGKPIPSLAFFHIPMQAYSAAIKEGEKLYGLNLEKPCSPVKADGMFEAMVELGSTKGVFVGHDHMNSFAAEYKGIRLTYGYSADHNIYLVPQLGGTVINIKNDGTFTQQGIYRNRAIGAPIIGKAV